LPWCQPNYAALHEWACVSKSIAVNVANELSHFKE
jgi:hypothetical protein